MATLEAVRGFWESHVNNEYYTGAARGSAAYFADIAAKRYRYHYHLGELFSALCTDDLGDKRALEVGCGIGIDTVSLARLGFREVIGVDLTAAAIAVARQRAITEHIANVRYDIANAESLPFASASFDYVYSFGVIHHTPSIQRALAEIYRVLVPGGRALVMIYHRQSLVDLIHRTFDLPYESPRHSADHCPVVNRYTLHEARELFSAFQYVEVHADYPFTYGMRHVSRWIPISVQRALGHSIGWHLMIDARKGSRDLEIKGSNGEESPFRCVESPALAPSDARPLDPSIP